MKGDTTWWGGSQRKIHPGPTSSDFSHSRLWGTLSRGHRQTDPVARKPAVRWVNLMFISTFVLAKHALNWGAQGRKHLNDSWAVSVRFRGALNQSPRAPLEGLRDCSQNCVFGGFLKWNFYSRLRLMLLGIEFVVVLQPSLPQRYRMFKASY